MVSYNTVVEKGKEVDTWKGGKIFQYKDKYYWVKPEEKKIAMEGNFL